MIFHQMKTYLFHTGHYFSAVNCGSKLIPCAMIVLALPFIINTQHFTPYFNFRSITGMCQIPLLNYLKNSELQSYKRYYPQLEPPLIKEGGRTFQKLSHLRGYEIFCQKGGINLKKGLMQKWVTFRIFSLFSQPCKITFLIHSGSVQKILTALFNLLWNTQKSKWTFFLCVTWRDVSQY